MRKPTSKEVCLLMAKYQHKCINQKLMWSWLFRWGFYEHWLEAYWND
jgi:hypothetical protein